MLSTFQCLPVVISSAAKYNRCQCKYNDGNPCKTLFTNEEFEEFRLDYACLDSNDLDIIILGKLSSGLHLSQSTVRSRQVQTERKAPRTDYFHHGRQICMHTFCYIHAIRRQRQHSASTTGQMVLSPASMSVQRNCLQMPCRLKTPNLSRTSLRILSRTIGIILPGRTSYVRHHDVKLLSYHQTVVHRHYEHIMQTKGAPSYRTFVRVWKALCPFVKTMAPKTDLCWTCQQGIGKLQKYRNEKVVQDIEAHLKVAKTEREFYK